MKARSGLYSIEGFQIMPGLGPGQYGFAINLSGDVARAITKGDKRNEKSPVFTDLLTMLKASSDKTDRHIVRLDYYKDTWLLLGMQAGGSCACFGINGNDRSDIEESGNPYLRYNPHNIDTAQQASAVLSTWLHWFNMIVTITEFRQW